MFIEFYPGCCGIMVIGGFDNFNGNCCSIKGFQEGSGGCSWLAELGEQYENEDKARLWLIKIINKYSGKFSLVTTTTENQPKANSILKSMGFEIVCEGTKTEQTRKFYEWSLKFNGYTIPDNICRKTGKVYKSAATMRAAKARIAANKRRRLAANRISIEDLPCLVRIRESSNYYEAQQELLGIGRAIAASAGMLTGIGGSIEPWITVQSTTNKGYTNGYPISDLERVQE